MSLARVFEPSKSKYLVFTADYIVPTLIIISVLATAYVALWSNVFKVKEIGCTIDFEPCEDLNVIAELEKLKGENIFSFSSKQISSKLTSGDFTIRKVNISKQLPATLSAELESVYPVVAIQVVGDTTWVVIDQKYRFIGTRTSDPNVPTVLVTGPIEVVLGQVPRDQLLKDAIKMTLTIAEELFTVKTLTLIDADTVELVLENDIKAIFTPKKDTLDQLELLQLVLSDDTITEGVNIIDVRFSQPVLR